jgi:hypothetical protein
LIIAQKKKMFLCATEHKNNSTSLYTLKAITTGSFAQITSVSRDKFFIYLTNYSIFEHKKEASIVADF